MIGDEDDAEGVVRQHDGNRTLPGRYKHYGPAVLSPMSKITEPLPPSVADLLSNASNIRAQHPSHLAYRWRRSHTQHPSLCRLFRNTGSYNQVDTPTASFYRIYQFLVVHDNINFRNELEYFCCSHPEWSVSSLPDPGAAPANEDFSNSQLRYTILAVLTKLMCDAFNRRIELGLPRDAPAIIEDFEELQARPKVYEEPPEWAKRALLLLLGKAARSETVFIPNAEGRTLNKDDEDVSKEFKDVGVIVQMPHIHFV